MKQGIRPVDKTLLRVIEEGKLTQGELLKLVKNLISSGANPNIKGSSHRTALEIAKEKDYQEIIVILGDANNEANSTLIGAYKSDLIEAIHKGDTEKVKL